MEPTSHDEMELMADVELLQSQLRRADELVNQNFEQLFFKVLHLNHWRRESEIGSSEKINCKDWSTTSLQHPENPLVAGRRGGKASPTAANWQRKEEEAQFAANRHRRAAAVSCHRKEEESGSR